jgi:hypothetical protein
MPTVLFDFNTMHGLPMYDPSDSQFSISVPTSKSTRHYANGVYCKIVGHLKEDRLRNPETLLLCVAYCDPDDYKPGLQTLRDE